MATVLLFGLGIPVVGARVVCTGYNEWSDGLGCYPCTRSPCSIGMFRQTCKGGMTNDARCIPCSMPPSNAVHVTGGLPYTVDNCMWACNEGFFRDGPSSMCRQCSTGVCPGLNQKVREVCAMGATKDAQCVCSVGHYTRGEVCVGCNVTACQSEDETLVKCSGTTTEDVSRCVPNSL